MMMLLKTMILQIHDQGRSNVKKKFSRPGRKEPASVDAEPTEKKVKEKKEREPTFVRTLLRPISKPIHVS